MLTDQQFLEAFDAGTLEPSAFDHRAHFRAAWLCLRAAPFRDAVGRLRRGLKRLAIQAGQPQRYHETITVAYARLIHRQMRYLGHTTWDEFQARSPELLAPDLGALRELYGADVLESPDARRQFVPPASWNVAAVDRFLQEFAEYQARLDASAAHDAAGPSPAGAVLPPEPVCVTAVLVVVDVQRAARWYAEAFGFDVAPFPEQPPYRFALLSRGGAELMLRAAERPDDVRPVPGWTLYIRLAGGRIRELFATLAQSGDVVRPLRRMPYRDVEFEIRDLDGYTVVVSELLEEADDIPSALEESRAEP